MARRNVRFRGQTGQGADIAECLLMMLWTAPLCDIKVL